MRLSHRSTIRDIQVMERLLGLACGPQPEAIVVTAHPDDETIGAGAQLQRFERLWIISATDGAPARLADVRGAGFASRHAYAAARRHELLAALHTGGVPPSRLVELGIVDQEASLDLPGLTRLIVRKLWDLQAEAILTHSYEGGHPDHDACAFAVQHACAIMERAHVCSPTRIEMTGYHARTGALSDAEIVTGEFLPMPNCPELVILLDLNAQTLKRRMFECFRSQQPMLSHFPIEMERFRIAPEYDFSLPPHPGRLFYEHFDWGITGQRWRELACDAGRELEPVAEP